MIYVLKVLLKKEKVGLPWWLSGKEAAYNAGDMGLIPGSGRFSGEENTNPLQYSCLQHPTDRGAWRVRHNLVTNTTTNNSNKRRNLFQASQYICIHQRVSESMELLRHQEGLRYI